MKINQAAMRDMAIVLFMISVIMALDEIIRLLRQRQNIILTIAEPRGALIDGGTSRIIEEEPLHA